MRDIYRYRLLFIIILAFAMSAELSARAQQLPDSADPGRIAPDPEELLPERAPPEIELPDGQVVTPQAPEDAKDLTFELRKVRFEGVTAFNKARLRDIYSPLIGETISLARVWRFAEVVSRRYQARGYFLSRAFVPAQTIEDGIVTIRVIEGHVSAVELIGDGRSNHVIRAIKQRITRPQPLSIEQLENALFLLNELPGYRYSSVLRANETDAGVTLALEQRETQAQSVLRFSNHGSRFSGPARAAFVHRRAVAPLQRTTISGNANLPQGNEVWSVNLKHRIYLTPEVRLGIRLSRSRSDPGFSLSDIDIESESTGFGISVNWQAILQRGRDLSVELALDTRSSNTDLFGIRITRDRIRTLRAGLDYSGIGPLGGSNIINAGLSRGIEAFGASDPGDTNISRSAADPDFTIADIDVRHRRLLAPDWTMTARLTGQLASKALYSAEEFGFGGPYMGRAYDPSEIVGDDGLAGSLKVSYTGLDQTGDFRITPFVFYDIGKVWNKDPNQDSSLSAASAGFGMDIDTSTNLGASISVAQPLSKDISTPPAGNNGSNPRVVFSLDLQF